MIKHISFDLWLTLIKSHPEFKEKRAIFLSREFNPLNYSVKEIMQIIQNTDKACDRLNEMRGIKVPAELMYRRILLKLGLNQQQITDEIVDKIKSTVYDLFMKLRPLFLNGSIMPMLHSLKYQGYSLNLSSNTGFIEGLTVMEALKDLNISEYFNFFVFSDQIGISKPSPLFFEKVHSQTKLEKTEILHVGDNYNADYLGATHYGFRALHIINQQYTINDIKRHL